jgi:hypothetical protein
LNSTGLVRRALYALAACCLTGLAVASLASAGGKRVFGVEDCNDPEVKPDRIVFACADFGLYANHFDWKHWGHRKAKSSGVLHAKVCKPDCVSGHFKDYPVQLTLHKVKTYSCDGFRARFYRKVKMTFPGARPPGIEPYVHSELFCT